MTRLNVLVGLAAAVLSVGITSYAAADESYNPLTKYIARVSTGTAPIDHATTDETRVESPLQDRLETLGGKVIRYEGPVTNDKPVESPLQDRLETLGGKVSRYEGPVTASGGQYDAYRAFVAHSN